MFFPKNRYGYFRLSAEECRRVRFDCRSRRPLLASWEFGSDFSAGPPALASLLRGLRQGGGEVRDEVSCHYVRQGLGCAGEVVTSQYGISVRPSASGATRAQGGTLDGDGVTSVHSRPCRRFSRPSRPGRNAVPRSIASRRSARSPNCTYLATARVPARSALTTDVAFPRFGRRGASAPRELRVYPTACCSLPPPSTAPSRGSSPA